MTPAIFKRLTLRRLRHVRTEAPCTMTKAQQRYKANYDRWVRFLPTFRPGDWVFLDRPPRARVPDGVPDDPEEMATKLRSKARGPYKVVSLQDHTVKILEDGRHNVVNSDRVSRAPEARPLVTVPGQKSVSADPEALPLSADDGIEACSISW